MRVAISSSAYRVPNAKAYEISYALVGPGGGSGPKLRGTPSQLRPMAVCNPPKSLHTFQVRAIGGSTGYYDRIDALSHRRL